MPIAERNLHQNMLKTQSERQKEKAKHSKQLLRNIRHKSVLHLADSVSRDFIKNVLDHRPRNQSKINGHGYERLGEVYMTVDRLLN